MTDSTKKTVVIVSAYSSGAKLAPLFKQKDFQCIHVTTKREWDIPRLRAYFNESDFCENIIINDQENLSSTIQQLQKNPIKFILPGCESGVSVADTLSEVFDVPKNDYRLTLARRNKYFMIEALREGGLSHPKQFKSGNLDKMLAWFRGALLKKVVLKPLSSSSSDSVFYCEDESEIRDAFATIFGAKDMYDEINKEVLIQEYIEGDEYIVNTVSRDGLHCIVDIWKGVSFNKDLVSNDSYADLIQVNEPAHKLLSDYVKKVLTVLGIQNGAAHSEIKIAKNEPYLIETGARLAGKVDFSSIETLFGVSQLSLTVEALLDVSTFKSYLSAPPATNKYARYVYFASDKTGHIHYDPNFAAIKAIPCLTYLNFTPKKGDQLRVTSKTFRSPRPGYAYLLSDCPQTLEENYTALRHAEKQLYAAMLGNDRVS